MRIKCKLSLLAESVTHVTTSVCASPDVGNVSDILQRRSQKLHICTWYCMLSQRYLCPQLQDDWVDKYWVDFRRRFVSLLSIAFRDLHPGLALSVVGAKKSSEEATKGTFRSSQNEILCKNTITSHTISMASCLKDSCLYG